MWFAAELDSEAKNSDPEVLEQRQALSNMLLLDGDDGGGGGGG
eukprot:SAG11_NODE_10178_length_849_cov_1.280000_1_plen_42_part_10